MRPRRFGELAARALLALALLSLGGCGRLELFAMVQEQPFTLASAPGCYTGVQAPRAWAYRAQVDMGEPPASSAPAGRQSAVSRTIRTSAVDSGFSFGGALVVVQILVMLAATILVFFVLAALQQKQMGRAAALGALLAALGLATLLLGYFSGSVLSLDNATDLPVRVTVDGMPVDVPPRSFTDVRVWGPSVDIRTETGGQLVEELTLSLDGNPLETLARVLVGDGRYIYTVCGTNRFSLGHYTYR